MKDFGKIKKKRKKKGKGKIQNFFKGRKKKKRFKTFDFDLFWVIAFVLEAECLKTV